MDPGSDFLMGLSGLKPTWWFDILGLFGSTFTSFIFTPNPLLHDILTSNVVATLSGTLAHLYFPSFFFESATYLLTLFRIGRRCHKGCVKNN